MRARFRQLLFWSWLALLGATGPTATGDPNELTFPPRTRLWFEGNGAWRLYQQELPVVSGGVTLVFQGAGMPAADARAVRTPIRVGETVRAESVYTRGALEWKLSLTARSGRDAVVLSYRLHSPAAADVLGANLAIELPAERFRAGWFQLEDLPPLPFPKKRLGAPTFANLRLAQLSLRAPGRRALHISRQQRGTMFLRDRTGGGEEAYVLLLPFHRAKGLKGVWELSVFLTFSDRVGPRMLSVRPNEAEVLRGRLFELTLDLWASYTNPYDTGEVSVAATFTDPTGGEWTLPGFVYQRYERREEAGAEVLRRVGPPVWKVRFTPTQTGTYRYTLSARTRKGLVLRGGEFRSLAAPFRGFVRVSKKDSRFFAFDDGTSYFAIGQNLCWTTGKGRTYNFEHFFKRMAEAGENYARIWLCSWDLHLEGRRLDNYRLDNAWRLDKIIELAAQYGIYIQFCLDNFHDYVTADKRKEIPYFVENGGPCRKPEDFFSSPTARRHYQRRLRYIVARWGYSPNIFAWQFWNEMDYAAPSQDGWFLDYKEQIPAFMVNWTLQMARYLRETDPFDHLVSTSLGLGTTCPELWKDRAMDFSQIHLYIFPPDEMEDVKEQDVVAFLRNHADPLGAYGKPRLVAEFGYVGTEQRNPLNDQDRKGIHLHQALWSSALSGAAGTVMPWWWDVYLDRHNLYYHYKALSRFLQGIDWAGGQWVVVRGETDQARLCGIKNQTAGYFWIQHPENTWYNRLVRKQPEAKFRKVLLDIPHLSNGVYAIEWWDTYRGRLIDRTVTRVDQQAIQLAVPDDYPDIACKVLRQTRDEP